MKKYKYSIFAILFVNLFWVNVYAQDIDSLSHYLEIAGRNNPSIQAEFFTYKASIEKIPQAGAYEDPQLEIGFFLEPMDIIGGKQVADFKLMQMFPWFGTKKAAQTEMTHMAQMAFEQFRETRDNLYLEVYTQWYLLCALQQQLLNNEANKQLLIQLEQLAISKFASGGPGSSQTVASPAIPTRPVATTNTATNSMSGMGSMSSSTNSQPSNQSDNMSSMGGGGSSMTNNMGSSGSGMSDVLRVQLEITELDSNMESLKSQIKAEKAKFNGLLNRPTDNEVVVPLSFMQTTFLLDEQSALVLMAEKNPMLTMIAEEGLSYKAKAEMDKKMSYPMFGVGVEYMLNKKTKDEMFGMGDMNGKDMVMPMVSVTIPIYRNKYKAQQRESKWMQEANHEKYNNTLNTLRSEMYQTKHQLDDASRKIELYKKQTTIAQTTYNLIIKEFVAGKSDLSNVIQVQRQLLDYQLKQAEAIANYNTMVASIQKLLSFEHLFSKKQSKI